MTLIKPEVASELQRWRDGVRPLVPGRPGRDTIHSQAGFSQADNGVKARWGKQLAA
jgi:hypothetical protein